MTVAYISHSDCGRHDTGWGHPEHVGRLRAIPRALREDADLFHALVHAVNAKLGNVGATVIHTEPVEPEPVIQRDSLAALVAAMAGGAAVTVIPTATANDTAETSRICLIIRTNLSWAAPISLVRIEERRPLFRKTTSVASGVAGRSR